MFFSDCEAKDLDPTCIVQSCPSLRLWPACPQGHSSCACLPLRRGLQTAYTAAAAAAASAPAAWFANRAPRGGGDVVAHQHRAGKSPSLQRESMQPTGDANAAQGRKIEHPLSQMKSMRHAGYAIADQSSHDEGSEPCVRKPRVAELGSEVGQSQEGHVSQIDVEARVGTLASFSGSQQQQLDYDLLGLEVAHAGTEDVATHQQQDVQPHQGPVLTSWSPGAHRQALCNAPDNLLISWVRPPWCWFAQMCTGYSSTDCTNAFGVSSIDYVVHEPSQWSHKMAPPMAPALLCTRPIFAEAGRAHSRCNTTAGRWCLPINHHGHDHGFRSCDEGRPRAIPHMT